MTVSTSPVQTAIWFKDVAVFDSRSGSLTPMAQVLVRDGLIESVTTGTAAPPNSDGAQVIDGTGRTLIPGLIDVHAHVTFSAITVADGLTADPGYLYLQAGRSATQMLMRGFTTVRDAGGPSFGLKRAIDAGVVEGPRMFPSGALISQSGGHGDFRQPYETPRDVCGHLSHIEIMRASVIADGVPEVLRAAREQLMHGATQIKMMAGGGVASAYDPIDITQFTADEMRAGVETAENYGTYVMVHAYTPRAVQQALSVGVRSIEHGQLLDEQTVEMIVAKDAWWSLQPFLNDADMVPEPDPARHAKALEVAAGTDRAYALAKKHGAKVAWGTDTLFNAGLASRQGEQLAKMVRWYTPAEVLTMGTYTNAQLLTMSGPRNPYPEGALGVIEPGAHADALLIDGNPLEDITLIQRSETAMAVIMKAGRIVKNILPAS